MIIPEKLLGVLPNIFYIYHYLVFNVRDGCPTSPFSKEGCVYKKKFKVFFHTLIFKKYIANEKDKFYPTEVYLKPQ